MGRSLEGARRFGGLSDAEREELVRLREEVTVLREYGETLQKAAAFFAKEGT